jgi:hypothetical protein
MVEIIAPFIFTLRTFAFEGMGEVIQDVPDYRVDLLIFHHPDYPPLSV